MRELFIDLIRYIIGVVVCLVVDFGLYYEEGNDIEWGFLDDGEENDGFMRRDSV